MTPSTLRRWILRHPLAWVLGLALALVGAQSAGVVHALSHTAAGGVPAASLTGSQADAPGHLGASGDCLTCLAVAALGGAAPAPVAALQAVDPGPPPRASVVAVAYAPRLLRAYASRAPPSSHSA